MIAVDTNVIVRFLTADEPTQTAIATDLLASHSVLVSSTVLVETEWVLRSRYRWPRARINSALQDLVRLHNVTVERSAGTAWTLERHSAGADLADMLHIAAAREATRFVTFDKRAVSDAGQTPPVAVELLA